MVAPTPATSITNPAKVSSQLMGHKQQPNKSVDKFAQDLKLFECSYGCRKEMDESSNGDAEEGLLLQGLWLKWQEEALPSAKTFHDALHQSRAAEQQEK